MSAPTILSVKTYLGDDHSWSDDDLTGALIAEKAAQSRRCRVPIDDAPWPADLAEALYRRIASNLANRALPLGVSTTLSDMNAATTRVGGLDREVRRLEAPYRKVSVG